MMSQTLLPAARLRRILLVDDEVNQITILKAGLAKLPDCEVATATGGRQALGLLAQQTFDLVITDYHMPEMDGLALAAAVHQQYPLLHIIMLTAFSYELLRAQAGDSPVRLVLQKPIDINQIRAVVLQALEHAAVPDDQERKS